MNVGKTEVMGCRIKKAVVSEEVENAMKERVSVKVDGEQSWASRSRVMIRRNPSTFTDTLSFIAFSTSSEITAFLILHPMTSVFPTFNPKPPYPAAASNYCREIGASSSFRVLSATSSAYAPLLSSFSDLLIPYCSHAKSATFMAKSTSIVMMQGDIPEPCLVPFF